MRPSLPYQRLVPLILLAALAAAFLALVAGRIGGGAGGTSANEVVNRAFANNTFKSGKFGAKVNVSLEGASNPQLGTFGIAVDGAFQNDARAPKGSFDISFDGLGRSLGFGFVSTGKQAFLELGNRAYRVPQSQLDELKKQNAQQAQSFAGLGALGVNPRSWLVNPTSHGTAKVGGGETSHVSAGLDTTKLAHVNEPQKISAPKHARPFERFQADFSTRFLGAFAGAGGGSTDSSGGSGGSSSGAAAGEATPTPAPTLPGSAQAYLDCVQKARTTAQLQQCAPLLD
jgi:hypothetical protein